MSQINTTAAINTALISQAASKIAGAAWDDATETDLVARLQAVRNTPRLGTDGDLTNVDRDALDTLIGLATGEKFMLHNYQTGEMIRRATDAEVCQCAVAQTTSGGSGAFAGEVDGVEVTCYVA